MTYTPGPDVDIGADAANITKLNLSQQLSDPSAPGANHWLAWFTAAGLRVRSATSGVLQLLTGSGLTGNVPTYTGTGTLGDSGVAASNLQNATALQGRPLAGTAPTDGQTMVWNAGGSTWQPGGSAGGIYGPLVDSTGALIVDSAGTLILAPR